jgi:hypothetical protein
MWPYIAIVKEIDHILADFFFLSAKRRETNNDGVAHTHTLQVLQRHKVSFALNYDAKKVVYEHGL